MLPKTLIYKTRLALAIGSIVCMPVNAATVVVDNTGDEGQLCTLRDAIVSVNNGALEDGCVNVSEELFGDNDKVLPFFVFNQNPTITLTQGEIDITQGGYFDASKLESLTINGGGNSRIFDISGAVFRINNVTITGGDQNGSGGAIAISNSIVVLENSTVSGNMSSGNGGGISVQNGTLGLKNSSIEDNIAGLSGGGVFLNQSEIALEQSSVSGNSASIFGGGLALNNTDGKIEGITISGNSTSTLGGGIMASNGTTVTLENSTISGNSAGTFGGGVTAESDSIIRLNHVTMTDNFASKFGGGVFHNSFDANTVISLNNSILSGNRSGLKAGTEIYSNASNLLKVNGSVLGRNLYSNASTFVTNPNIADDLLQNNVVATSDGNHPTSFSQIIGPLTDNGGPTLTHKPPSSSPAIGSADSNSCLELDQADQSRSVNACDAGALNGEQQACFVVPTVNDGKVATFCL